MNQSLVIMFMLNIDNNNYVLYILVTAKYLHGLYTYSTKTIQTGSFAMLCK